MIDYLKLPYIEISQPIGTFYVTKLNWKELLAIAEADIRKIEDENTKNDSFDSYLGIQRNVSEKRVKDIGNYVRTIDATFPTGIILSIPSKSYYKNGSEISQTLIENIESELKVDEVNNIFINNNELHIRKSEALASILDGQHRIEGLKRGFEQSNLFNENEDKFELNVTIFVDLDIDDQAQIFSVINKAQTKVNKSLVYDLYEYSVSRSPQKTAHDIVRLLNRKAESPFYRKIKILGHAVDKEKESIAQATFVELIINYISKDPMRDRDLLKKKKKLKEDYDIKRLIFRDAFIDNDDELITLVLWNYFTAVAHRWPKSWKTNAQGNILNKSTGLIALFRFLKDVFLQFNHNYNIEADKYLEVLNRVEIDDDGFSPEIFLPGSIGQSKLYKELLKNL